MSSRIKVDSHPQILFPALDSAPGLRGERASKARASKVLVTGLQTNSWSLLVPQCVNDPSLATTRPPSGGLQSVLCGFYMARPGPPAPASSTREGAVVHRSWDASISHKKNWRSLVPWRSLVLVSHCPRHAPSTMQSRDPETHLQAKAQLLSLSQGQMLSSEVLWRLGSQKCSCPDRSLPPCYSGPSVVLASPWSLCWVCGLGCELLGLPPPTSVSGA